MGHCQATIAYAQLIAENAVLLEVPREIVTAIFHTLVGDLSASALALAALPAFDSARELLTRRMVAVPRTPDADWDYVSVRLREE